MPKTMPFEQAMTELEEVVKQLEQGDLSLEDSLKRYEKGIHLARKCQTTLTQATQKVDLMNANDSASEVNHD